MSGKVAHSEGKDQAVQGTNDDAAISKLSAVAAGYYSDPFLPIFVTPSHRTKRAPLINRGYYARASAVSIIINQFLDTFTPAAAAAAAAAAPVAAAAATPTAPAAAADVSAAPAPAAAATATATAAAATSQRPRCQIVSLGAGYDTMFFRLQAQGKAPYKYVEIDYPETARRKSHLIRSVPQLANMLTPLPAHARLRKPQAAPGDPDPLAGCAIEVLHADPSEWPLPSAAPAASDASAGAGTGPTAADAGAGAGAAAGATVLAPETGFAGYALVGADLRDLDQLTLALRTAGVDLRLPTLFLSECVLVYLQPHESAAIVEWAARTFGASGCGGGVFVCYEQILPWDAFGQQMMRNLAGRGCALLSLESVPDLNAHCARYLRAGWSVAAAWDMNDIYRYFLPPNDVQRIEALEMFDEFEEWHIIQGHYHISVAALVPGLPPPSPSPPASSSAAAAPTASGSGAGSAAASTSASASASACASASVSSSDAARAAAISASPLSRVGLLGRAKTTPAGAAGGALHPAYMGTEAAPMAAAAAQAAQASGGAVVDPIASKLAIIEAYKRRHAAAVAATASAATASAAAKPAPKPGTAATTAAATAATAAPGPAGAPKPGPVRGSNQ